MVTKIGRWDCPYCGHKGNPGYSYECDGCEHPRPHGIKFYLPENAPIATPEQIEMMGHDPNWYCSYCQSGNRDSEPRCWKCGASRGTDSKKHETRIYVGNNIPRSAEEADAMEKAVTPETEKLYDPPDDPYNPVSSVPAEPLFRRANPSYQDPFPEEDGKKKLLTVGGILGVLLVLFGIYFFFFRTTERLAVVDGFSWSQNVAIEEYQTHHKEGWSIPVGGRETGSEIRQSGTDRVPNGSHYETVTDTCYRDEIVYVSCTRDNGNGSFDVDTCPETESVPYTCESQELVQDYKYVPVYNTWYFYDIDEWTNIGNYPTSGNDHKPYFDPVQPKGDKQRRVEQEGTYTVHFVCDGLNPFDRTYDKNTWLTFDYKQTHKIKVNAMKMILSVE